MDLYITTSSRLTPAEEEELRSNSGSTEQLQDPTLPNDEPIKSAKLSSPTASPVIPAVVSPSVSVLDASVTAATGPVKPKMLVPIAIVDTNQKQKSDQQGSPGRRSIDAGSREILQEEVRSQIQASASIDDDMEGLVAQSSEPTQLRTPIQQQQQQKPPIPTDKALNDRKQHLSKPTSLSILSSGITPTILVSASSPTPTVKLPSTFNSPRTTASNNSSGEKSAAVAVMEPSKPARKPTIQKDPSGPVYDSQLSSSGVSVHSSSPTVISALSTSGGVLQQRRTSSLGSYTSLTTTLVTGSNIQQHPSTSSLALEAAGPPPATPPLDTQHFATVFHELDKSIEQLEALNDQILEKMTLYQPPPPSPAPPQQHQQHQPFIVPQMEQRSQSPSSTRGLPPSPQPSQSPASTTPIGTPPPSAHHYQTHVPAPAPLLTIEGNNNDDDGWRRILKGKSRAVNLEEDSQSIAQSFTDLVMDSWPRIYKIPPEPWRTPQMRQDRINTATRLKDAIVVFWSVQSYFQERAELILDVQQVIGGLGSVGQ